MYLFINIFNFYYNIKNKKIYYIIVLKNIYGFLNPDYGSSSEQTLNFILKNHNFLIPKTNL